MVVLIERKCANGHLLYGTYYESPVLTSEAARKAMLRLGGQVRPKCAACGNTEFKITETEMPYKTLREAAEKIAEHVENERRLAEQLKTKHRDK